MINFIRFAVVMFIATLGTPAPAPAQVEATQFESAQQEFLYNDLIGELRCLVCANQSLSDSNSDLAKDLRGKVHDMVRGGRSRAQIIDYLVARYGEYVLYRPRFSRANVFLWFAPLLAVLAGLAFILFLAAGKSGRQDAPYSTEQLQKARALLKDKRVDPGQDQGQDQGK